jgi:tetratricopeptide (TPR) repeat protein
VSWDELNEHAQRLGCLLSLFALAPIPWSLVERSVKQQDLKSLENARVELENLHLLQGEQIYHLHQIIRECFRNKYKNFAFVEEQKYSFCRALVAVAQEIPDSPTQEFIESVRDTIPHLVEIAQNLTDEVSDENLMWVFVGIGRFYSAQRLYGLAEPWYEKCVSLAQTRLGEEHPYVAGSYNNLARLYSEQGKNSEAEQLYIKALDLMQRLLGEDHPYTASVYQNLARLYRFQGRNSEAEPLYIKTLELMKYLLGEDHPTVANTYNNLAGLYYSQQRYTEAERLYLKVLELLKHRLGNEHPDVATSYNNLAEFYSSQRKYSEAAPLFQQALKIYEQQLGIDHLETMIVRKNYADFLHNYASFLRNKPKCQLTIPDLCYQIDFMSQSHKILY